MRKQYHFRPSENGLSAWDVDRLVELSKNLKPQLIPLDSIKELDENYWFEHNETIPSCRAVVQHFRLMDETDLNYPIILFSDGRVMDGMHRVCKALFEGQKTIKAVIFKFDPEPDYQGVQNPDELPY